MSDHERRRGAWGAEYEQQALNYLSNVLRQEMGERQVGVKVAASGHMLQHVVRVRTLQQQEGDPLGALVATFKSEEEALQWLEEAAETLRSKLADRRDRLLKP